MEFAFITSTSYHHLLLLIIMGYYYYNLRFWSLFAILILVQSEKNVERGGPVINVTKHFSFADFDLRNPRVAHQLQLLGSAAISNETGRIQIPDVSQNPDLKQLAGRAIYSFPVRLFDPPTHNPASFQTTFSFQIQAAPSSSGNFDNSGGSGLTFIIAPDEFTVGRPGPWLGMLTDACDDDYKAVGFEFDTHKNSEFGDPNDNHLGIDLGSIISTTTINVSDFGINFKDGSVHRVWITYDGLRRYLDIRLGSDTRDYPYKPVYAAQLDLSPFLKEYMFVGFSASTSNYTQIHNLISWNFTSVSRAFLHVPSVETCEAKLILQDAKDRRFFHRTETGFFIFLAIVVLVFAALLGLYHYIGKRRGKHSRLHLVISEKHRPRLFNKPRRFSIAEISSATRCFIESQKLDSDERGTTYKGTLNGCHVVVKRFSTQFFKMDRRRVGKEIKAMSKIRHPNLVPIRGWCLDHQETMVVYDYIINGNLENWLYGIGVLPWTRRCKVVKDVAEALSFLHSKNLAHKNLKTRSVFLDMNFRAVLGDFGFVMPSDESKQFEAVVSHKVDVFDFGVFALEVVSGRRKSEPNNGLPDLLHWAWYMHEKDEKVNVVDPRMGSTVNAEQAVRVMEIALLCTLNEDKGRPSMEEVVEILSSEKPTPQLPMSQPISLYPYSSCSSMCNAYSCAPFKQHHAHNIKQEWRK